jgi:CBS domain-containing protein
MTLLKIARVPAPTVSADTNVQSAVAKMVEVGVGAVVIVDEDEEIQGIFTERDVMTRVAAKSLPADTTKVGEVMSSEVEVAHRDTHASEALSIMDTHHFRHLPIVDDQGKLLGMLSIRHLLHRMVEDLSQELEALDSYVSADGPGG